MNKTELQQVRDALKFAYNDCESDFVRDQKIDPAINLLDADLARVVEPEWMPIETAPEGTMILLVDMKAMEVRDWCFVGWMAGGKLCGHRMGMPTHWMPLPPAPEPKL